MLKGKQSFRKEVVFRDPIGNENIKHIGIVKGLVLYRGGLYFGQQGEYKGVLYELSDAAVIKGMSGGPVYSEDGSAILGMTAYKTNNVDVDGTNYSNIALFVPASVIISEWENFQNKNK